MGTPTTVNRVDKPIVGHSPPIGGELELQRFNYEPNITGANFPTRRDRRFHLLSFFPDVSLRGRHDSSGRETSLAFRTSRRPLPRPSWLKYLFDGPHLRTKWFRAQSLTRLWRWWPEKSSVSLRLTWGTPRRDRTNNFAR